MKDRKKDKVFSELLQLGGGVWRVVITEEKKITYSQLVKEKSYAEHLKRYLNKTYKPENSFEINIIAELIYDNQDVIEFIELLENKPNYEP